MRGVQLLMQLRELPLLLVQKGVSLVPPQQKARNLKMWHPRHTDLICRTKFTLLGMIFFLLGSSSNPLSSFLFGSAGIAASIENDCWKILGF